MKTRIQKTDWRSVLLIALLVFGFPCVAYAEPLPEIEAALRACSGPGAAVPLPSGGTVTVDAGVLPKPAVSVNHNRSLSGPQLLDVLEAFQARAEAKLARLTLADKRIDAHVSWLRSTGQLASRRLDRRRGIARKRR